MNYNKSRYIHFIRAFIALIILTVSACSHKPYSVQAEKEGAQKPAHEVYIINHGWHTAFVLPAHNIHTQIPELKNRFPTASYLTFGWGDEEVYQADETKFWPSTIAIMLPTTPVVHVVSRKYPPASTKSTEVATLCLTRNHYDSLLHYIEHSLKRTSSHALIPTPLNDGSDSQFYYAEGTYYFMNTCNNWTAKGLQSAGLDISPTFKFTADSVLKYLKQNKSKQTQPCLKSVGK